MTTQIRGSAQIKELTIKYDRLDTSDSPLNGELIIYNSSADKMEWTDTLNKLNITGIANTQQLIVKGFSTQTQHLAEWQKSDGTVLIAVNVDTGKTLDINGTFRLLGTSSSEQLMMVFPTYTGGITGDEGIRLGSTLQPSASVNTLYSVSFQSTLAGSSYNLTNFNATYYHVSINANYTGTLTNVRTLLIADPTLAGGGSAPATIYGLYINNQTIGTSANYAIVTNAGKIVFNETGDSATDFRVEGDTNINLFFTQASTDRIGVGTASPFSLFDISSSTGGILTLSRADTTATAADVIGTIQWWNNDAQLTTQNIYANIIVTATSTVTTDAAAGTFKINVTGSTVGGSPIEHIAFAPTTEAKIGVFGVTPAVRQSHIIDADGTLVDITTKFNTLLGALETYGWLKTA